MGYLDNSGDIIVDVVLTDAGRQRIARGDGSFRIVKFALGDDEIDYSLYNKDSVSGSAYFDVDILQLPVFESFTNNTSVMQSKLLTLSRNDLLYLPIIQLNDSLGTPRGTRNHYLVAVDEDTEDALAGQDALLLGVNVGDSGTIMTDNGLDTTEISPSNELSPELRETQFMIKLDSRFGEISSPDRGSSNISEPVSVDDDYIASYVFTENTDPAYVTRISSVDRSNQVISGPRGNRFEFRVKASIDLQSSTYLFTTLGSTETIGADNYYIIDSSVVVHGMTTGYSLTIPVRFIKLQ